LRKRYHRLECGDGVLHLFATLDLHGRLNAPVEQLYAEDRLVAGEGDHFDEAQIAVREALERRYPRRCRFSNCGNALSSMKPRRPRGSSEFSERIRASLPTTRGSPMKSTIGDLPVELNAAARGW
jgi:hypothetical protein